MMIEHIRDVSDLTSLVTEIETSLQFIRWDNPSYDTLHGNFSADVVVLKLLLLLKLVFYVFLNCLLNRKEKVLIKCCM